MLGCIVAVSRLCPSVSWLCRARKLCVSQAPSRSRYKICIATQAPTVRRVVAQGAVSLRILRLIMAHPASYRSLWRAVWRCQAYSSYHDTVVCIVTHLPVHAVARPKRSPPATIQYLYRDSTIHPGPARTRSRLCRGLPW